MALARYLEQKKSYVRNERPNTPNVGDTGTTYTPPRRWESTEPGKNGKENQKVHEKEKKREKSEEQGIETDKFRNILKGLKNIFIAECSFEEKVKLAFNYIIEEAMKFFVEAVSSGELIRKLMSFYYV